MRLILALAVIAASELAIRVVDSSMDPAPTQAVLKPLQDLPTAIGAWTGHDVPVDRHLFRNSGAADMVNRVYRNSVDDQVAVNVGVWLDYQPVMPHKPEICYPSAGWEIEGRKLVKVSPPGGHPFKARILALQNKEQRVVLLYWALIDSTVALDDGEVREVLQRHRGFGKTRPPVIKVMLQSDAPDPAAGEQQLLDLAGQLALQLDAFLRQPAAEPGS